MAQPALLASKFHSACTKAADSIRVMAKLFMRMIRITRFFRF
jgi:hypothetical protein